MYFQNSGSPISEGGGSRPSSITRSSRENFVAELETLPSESVEHCYELNEEILDIEDVSDTDYSVDDLSESIYISEPIESVETVEDAGKLSVPALVNRKE